MSWSNKSATLPTRSMRSASLSTTERIMALGHKSAIASRTITSNRTSTVEPSATSTHSSTVSLESSASETSSDAPQPVGVQRLYLLLPNHKCPNKKECPFHPPEEEEDELEEAEVTFVNKRRAMSLASHEGRMISEQLLAEKLAKINQQISSHLMEGNKLHLPRKTSHDITLPAADLDRLRYDHSNTPATSSTREHSVTSDYDLDSGVTFDSCSDRELDEETLPLIQEEIVVPDLVLPVELKLQTEVQKQTTTTEVVTTVELNETSTVESVTFTSQTSSTQQQVENSAAITIEEQVPEVHTKPSFNKELEYLTATEGSLVKLECCVAGDPRPNVKWLKNNEVIDPDNGYKIQRSEDGTVTLIIEGAEVEDSGSYTCVADNVAGTATTQSKIRVQKATEVVPEPVVPEVKPQQPLVPPQFTAKLKNRTIEEGATVHLKCSVTSFPEPTYRWFKDGKEITDGLGVKLRNNDGFLSLEIARVKQSLAGEYTVEASNTEGIISSSCILQVEGDKEIEPLELDIVRPKFIRKIQDLHVKQGEDAIFSCTATGKPMPEFKWHRDMINITASDLVVIEFNNQGRAQMTLKKVKPSDYGLYNCVAQSRAGRAKCSAYLHVTERTTSPDKEVEFAIMQARKESSVERSNNLGSPPSLVLMLPDTLDIVVGGKLKLDSSVQGYPMPLVTWHKGVRGLMYSQRHRIVPCGSLHTMEIPQVMALDKGEYIVRATNIYGTVQSSCYVNILPKGSNISAPDYTRKTLVVEAKENLIAPYFVKHLPKTIDALLGMNIRLDCILREGIELIKRSQSESTFQDLEKDKKELVDEGFHGEFIPLEAKSKDKSRSHSEDKKQSEFVINKPSKQEETIAKAINFTTTLKDLVQPAGSEVIFECSTSGATEPEVKWYKDGKELVSNNRIIVVAAGSKHTLRIADVRSTDEGVYTCKLPQEADNKSCSAALTVTEEVRERTPPSKIPPVEQEQKPTSDKKSPQPVLEEKIEKPEVYVPPSFSETLPKTTAAKHGDNVELTCQLASPDVASVEWELDGTQLQGEARYLASSDESNSRHKLTIQSVTGQDSGKYTCLVYLKNGDFVQTGTQLIVTAAKPTPVQKKEEVEKKEKPEIYVPPSFSETLPKNTAAKHGDNVELACQLASPDVASVKWELNGTQLPEEARYLASSDESNSQHKLTIQSVTGQDSGKYTCVVYLKNGDLVHTSTQLIVTAAKPTPVQKNEDVKPHFTTTLTDTVVKDGEGLTLECDIEGNPRPQILWLRDDVEVFDSSDFQISTIGCHCKLQVSEIYPEDEGNYSCRAVNALGEATSTCYVSVEDKNRAKRGETREAQGDKKKSKKEQEVSEQAPELVVKPRRQFIDDGGKAKFKSSFDGSQNTKLFWSKNGQVLKESENIVMYEADGFHFLEVKKVSAEDVGMYSVTVQNSVGSDTAEAELEVFEKPKLLTRSGPEWERSLQDLTVEEDDANVKLVCTCKELTQPSVRWYHNGKEVFSGFHMKIQHEAQTATLTIKSIQEKDAGEFKCVMTGKNGELETSCILSIGGPEIMEPPVFEKELHDMEVDEGDKLELDVEVKGAALARVTWYHNNIEIMHDNPQYLIASSGNVHTLTVPHATSESSGEYVCEAYNDTGSTDTYCFIEVRDVKRPEPPSFVVHPTSLSAHVGQAATFTCQVKGQPMPNVLWKKTGVAIATDQKFKITRILDCHTLTVHSLSYMDQGEYVCYLYNTQGEMSYTCTLHVTTDQDYSLQSQNVDFKNKSRMSQLEHAQQMSQREKADSRDNQQFLPEYFNEKRRSHWEDESKHVEVFTSKLAKRPSFDSTIGETTITTSILTQTTPIPHHENIETRQSYQDNRLINESSNLFSEENWIKPVKATTYTAESSNLFPEEKQKNQVQAPTYTAESSFNPRSSNSQQVTSTFKSPVNKIPHKLVETNNVANNAITDFKSVLKQRQAAPITLSENSNVMDFRTTTPQIKTNDFKRITSATETFEEIKPSSVYHTNLSVKQSPNGKPFVRLTPVTDHATPSPSSLLYSSASEKRDQMSEDYMHTKNEAVANNLKQTSNQQNINYSRGADVFSTYPDEPSSIVKQNWRKGNSQFSDNSPSIQDFNTPSKNVTKQTESVNVLVKCNNAIGFNGVNDISGIEDGTEDSVLRRKCSVSMNKTDNSSLNNGIEPFGKGPYYGRRGSENGKRSSIDPLQVTSINQQSVSKNQFVPDSYPVPGSYSVQQDKVLPESEKLEVKLTPSKVDLSKLSACKVNFCEFNPSEPQSEATTLEVTSVSASVPLRQSISSPQFYPRPYSVTDSDQKTTQFSDIKFEDDNDVFTDPSTESASTYHEIKFSSKPENNKQNLRSFESREKTPGNETETKKGILSKKSSDPVNVNQRKDMTDNQTERINTRLSEKYPDYKEQKKVESPTRFSTFSRSETSSSSGNLAQASHLSAKSTENLVDDFRKVKLKSAPGINKDKFDLAKSKFMSKSTESIFIDVKLKPVSKPTDNYKKSEISSNAERIRASSKSMNFLKISSTSPLKNVSNYSPVSKTDTASAHTTSKFSECVKTFSSDAKPRILPQNSRYQKSVQSSKIRTSSGKPLPGGAAKASSNRKSKGVGAKFEEAITDSKTSKEQGPYTSLNITRSRQVDIKAPTQPHFTGYNSGKTSDSLKVTEPIPSKICLETDVNAASKSNSDNTTRESNSEGFQENVTGWIKKSVQIDSLPKLTSNKSTYSETGRSSVILSDSTKMLEGDRYTTETNNLVKTNRMSSPNSSRNEQHARTDLPTRTFLNPTEGRIIARTRRANLRNSNGSEWLPHDSGKIEVNQRIKNFEIRNPDVKHAYKNQKAEESEIRNPDVKHAYTNQKAEESSRDSTKLIPDTDSRKSSRSSAQVMKTNLGTPSDPSDLEGKERLNSREDRGPGLTSTSSNSVSYSFREPEIFTTAITMTPKFEAARPTSSIIITKAMMGSTASAVPSPSETGNNKTISSAVIESKESFTTPTTSPPTDAKLHLVSTWRSRPEVAEQCHLAENGSYTSAVVSSYLKNATPFAPAEQFICVEPPPGEGSLESQTGNDLPHYNNTSASWVKPRSQRQPNIYPLDETELTPYKESLKLLTDDSESVLSMASISSSSSDTSNTTVDSGYTRNYFRRRAANNMADHKVSESLHPDNTESWNGISYSKDINNQGTGLNKNTEENIRSSSNLQSITRKHEEKPRVGYVDKPSRETLEQQQIQFRDSSQVHTRKSTSFPQNYESIGNIKENELPNVSNDDSSGLVYMSRRQRRLLEKINTSSTDSDVKPEDGEIIQNNLSKSYLSDLNASDTSSEPEKKETYLYNRNPASEVHSSRIESANSRQNFEMKNMKSDSAISRMSTELDKPKSNFDLANIKQAEEYYTNQTGTLENDMDQYLRFVHTNDSPNQNQRFPYDKDLTKNERKPSVHQRIINMDRTEVSSTASQQNETRLSKSQKELTPQTQPAISTTPPPEVSLLQLNEPETDNDLQHFPPSFPLPLHDVSVTLGTKAVLLCRVTGNPRPEVKWLLNLKQLEPSQGVEITMSEETSQLTITQMTREYQGDYTCWARNLLGTVSSHCTLSLNKYAPQLVTDSYAPYGITGAESKPAVGNMSASSAVLELASSDIGTYDEFPFNPRDVTINTADKFQDLYEVDKEVGKGKFGVVYKCKLKSNNTVWAAKVIKCREAAKIELRREIEIMNKLRHPKLLQLWDAFEAPRQIVMVMEYISAGELFERVIADDFYLTENDCIHFMRQICEGVSYMHSNGVIHLDLKPENILCVSENSNRIKIIDFGLARFHTPGQSTRVLFGTPEFIAPEVINYDEISFETDVWSLGVICYVLLSGLSPFLGDNETETLANVTEGEYDFDDEAFEEISDLAKDFIGQLLIKRKEKRLLSGQCLSHPWLNQDEVDGSPAKRLNTEKLKRFMVRQKWLKTGNAVKAVSRLLKSNSLTGFGPFDRSAGSESGSDTPFHNRRLSSLQSTAEITGDEDDDADEDEPNTVFDQITPATSNVLEHVHQNPSLEDSSISKEENALSAANQNNFSKMNVSSTWKSMARYQTAPILSDKNNERLIPETNSEENMEPISKEHETKNTIISRSSRNVSRETGLNQNVEKSPDLTPSLAPKETKSTHISSTQRQREAAHLPKWGSDDTLLQAPRFTKSMTRCKTCAGDVARFAVVVIGTPPLHVTWFLEEEEIIADTRHTLISNENTGSFSLTIRNVEEDDEGEYTCKAVNSQGECTCSAELAVLLL